MRSSRVLFAITLFLAVSAARQAAAIPTDELLKSLQATGDVNDFAHILSPADVAKLEARCRTLREKTGAQLAVVTIESLKGGQIDDFANKLFARWGIGQKEKKNGLLLLVAMEEHKSKIEVGYGLEPIIPDILAGRILDHEVRPRFRQQQYAEGLLAAVNALCAVVARGEPAERAALAAQVRKASGGGVPTVLFLAVFVAVGSMIAGVGLGSRVVQLILFGLVFTGLPLMMGMAIAWPLAPLLQVPISLLSAAGGFYLARHGSGPSVGGRGGAAGGGSTWNWGGMGGTSGGSWGGGGGGFSQDWGGFGGGSSGGGGASSDW